MQKNTHLYKQVPVQTNDQNQITILCIPNGITITSKPDEWGLSVTVNNIGVDPVDKIVVSVTATDNSTPQVIDFGKVWPVIGETNYSYDQDLNTVEDIDSIKFTHKTSKKYIKL